MTRDADAVLARVQGESQIPVIRNIAATFAEITYPEILDTLAAAAEASNDTDSGDVQHPAKPTKQTVAMKRLHLPGAGEVLETADDVERYLAQLRQMLLTTINDNKRIAL